MVRIASPPLQWRPVPMKTRDSDFSVALIRRWLFNPGAVASIAPSGWRLADAMAALVPVGDGVVVELGPGTGAITQGLIRAGLKNNIWALERDPMLFDVFDRRFPGMAVFGDARELPRLLRGAGKGPVLAVVSSLGLRSMPRGVLAEIAQAIGSVLPAEAPWIQYTYGLKNPLPSVVMEEGGWEAQAHPWVWKNVPPARIWTYRRS